nr:recombinase family protein [uncultured Acetatifactor sp.]
MRNENSNRQSKYFYAAMYLRLSREDSDAGAVADSGSPGGAGATFKAESNSIGSQRELIRSFIREQEDMELFDCYADDNYSGSNFERPEFKRMISDIEAGRVNCVIVKDLSRFGRDYIETGRYLDQVFPALGVRFIALTDRYDSFSADAGERNIVLPVKNFINDSYCRDISTKVKSQLAVKRRKGECLAAFAVYGYRKSAEDRNTLLVDDYAAEIVRRIFAWKIEGMAVSAIAEKLNDLHILSPKEYKKSLGLNYRGGFTRGSGSKWSSPSIRRILTNEVYLGHLVQGRTERVNIKVKKRVEKPEEEWIRVEDAHEPIISADDFAIVQNLLKADGRVSPKRKEISPFMGLLFCGDCREQMVRRVNCYKGTEKVYYICSTKNRGEGCSRHSIEETVLKELAGTAIRRYANDFLEQEKLFAQAKEREANLQAVISYNKEIARLKKEQEKYYSLTAGLYEDLRTGVITKEEFGRLHGEFQKKAENLAAAEGRQEQLVKEMFKAGVLSAGRLAAFQDSLELKEIDRHTLASLVKRIWVYEGKRIEIEFYFTDQYQAMKDFCGEDGLDTYMGNGQIGNEAYTNLDTHMTIDKVENQMPSAIPGMERGA